MPPTACPPKTDRHPSAAAPAGQSKKSKRDIEHEVHTEHDGDWHAFLDHHWNLQRRATPDHELHELHELDESRV